MFCGTIFCLHLLVLKFSHEQVLSSASVNVPEEHSVPAYDVETLILIQGGWLEVYFSREETPGSRTWSLSFGPVVSYIDVIVTVLTLQFWMESLLTLVFPLNSLLDIGCTKVSLSMCYTDRTLVAQEVPRVRAIQITNLNSLLDIGCTRVLQSPCYTDREDPLSSPVSIEFFEYSQRSPIMRLSMLWGLQTS